jgi:hypothetical protein
VSGWVGYLVAEVSMQTKLAAALAATVLVGIATPASAWALKPGERQGDQLRPSLHTQRLYECRALARAHNFGFHFIRKGRFMRACMKQPS